METTKPLGAKMPTCRSLVDQMEALKLDSHPNKEFFATTQTMQNFKKIIEYLNFINARKYCPMKKLLVLLESNADLGDCVLKKSIVQNALASAGIAEKFDVYIETLLRYVVCMLCEGSNDDTLQILKYFNNLKETMFYFAKNPLFANFETRTTVNHFVRHLIVMIREESNKREVWKRIYLLQIMRFMIICIGIQEEHCQIVLEGLLIEFNEFLQITKKDVFENSWIPLEYYLNIFKELMAHGVLRKREEKNVAAAIKIKHVLVKFSKSNVECFSFENQLEDILSWFQLNE